MGGGWEKRPSLRSSTGLDREIGARLSLARKAQDLSIEEFAAKLGVSYERLKDYEAGATRISAGRLHCAAVILGVPISFFFPETEPPEEEVHVAHEEAEATGSAFLGTAEGLALTKAFSEIGDPELRRRAVELVRSINRNCKATARN